MEDVTLTVGLNAEDVKDKANEIQQDVEKIFSGLNGKELSPAVNKAVAKLRELNEGITDTLAVMRELETESAIPNDEYENAKRSVDELKESLAQAIRRKQELEDEGQTGTSEYKDINIDIAKLSDTISYTEGRLKRLADQGKVFTFTSEEAKARYEELTADLEESVSSMANLVREAQSFRGVSIPTTFLETLQTALPRLALAFQRVGTAAVEALGNGIRSAANMAKSGLDNIVKTVASIPLQPLIAAKEGVVSFAKSLLNLGKTLLSIPINVLTTARDAVGGLARAIFSLPANIINSVVTGIQKLGNAIVSLPHTVFSLITGKVQELGRNLAMLPVNMLRTAANAAKDLAKNLMQAAGAGIKRGISGLASAIFGIKRSSDSTNDSVKRGIKLFIKYAFGVRSFFFLYRKIRKAISEGFGDMAHVSAPLNNQISQLSTSLLYLRNAVTSAFAPIASFVIPILTTLINTLAAAANAVGQFMAALFGQTSFIKAKKVYKDYTKSLDKGAAKQQKNASKTQKKVDKLQKTIAGFDDVNILEDKNKDDSPSGGGGGGGGAGGGVPWEDPSNMFETTEVEAKFKKLADKIKGFFKKGDWEGLGKFIADGINTGFRAIDKVLTSTKVQERLWKIVNAITRTFNSLVKNIDWKLIGKTFGDGINLIVKTLNQLYTGINWYNLGASISVGLNNLINTVDFEAIGNLFANKFNAIINFAAGAILSFDWTQAGKKLGQAINGLFLKVNWNTLAITLAGLVNGLFSTIQNAISTIKWTDIAKKLTKALNTLVTKVNWANVGKTLSSLVTTALDFISTALDEFDWAGLGNAIGDFLTSINWGSIILKVIQVAVKAFTGLAITLITLICNVFSTVISGIDKYVQQNGGSIAQGLLKGIANGLKKVGSWIKKNVFDPIFNAIKKAFGIASPAKKMESPGSSISEGLLKGITNGLKSIGSWIKTNVFNKIKSAITTAFGIASNVASKIVTYGSSIIGGLKKGVTDNLKTIATWVKTNIFNKIKSAITSAFSIAKNVASTFEYVGKSILGGIKKGITSNLKSLKDYVGDLPQKLKDAIKGVSSLFESIGSSIVSGIKKGITDNWITRWFKDKVGTLKTAGQEKLKSGSPSKVFRDEIGKTIPWGIAVGIDDASSMALNSMSNLADGLISAATDSISMPPIVGGKVIPYSVGKFNAEDTNSTLNQVLDMLQYSKDNSISIDELQSVLIDIFRRYMNIQLYLGDEQVARHANAGNLKLNRRYNTT